jgi:hypothetical protein
MLPMEESRYYIVLFNGYVNNNTTGVTSGTGTVYPYDVPEFIPDF